MLKKILCSIICVSILIGFEGLEIDEFSIIGNWYPYKDTNIKSKDMI